MLQQDDGDDYVVATGEAATVRDFCEAAFAPRRPRLGEVRPHRRALRAARARSTRSSVTPRKAQRELGWKATTGWRELAELMVDADSSCSTTSCPAGSSASTDEVARRGRPTTGRASACMTGRRGVLAAVVDQALSSGTNFLTAVLAARLLTPESYGSVVLALSVAYSAVGLGRALIGDALLSFAPELGRAGRPGSPAPPCRQAHFSESQSEWCAQPSGWCWTTSARRCS